MGINVKRHRDGQCKATLKVSARVVIREILADLRWVDLDEVPWLAKLGGDELEDLELTLSEAFYEWCRERGLPTTLTGRVARVNHPDDGRRCRNLMHAVDEGRLKVGTRLTLTAKNGQKRRTGTVTAIHRHDPFQVTVQTRLGDEVLAYDGCLWSSRLYGAKPGSFPQQIVYIDD